MAIFGPKPWVNPFGKMSIFRLFELLVFIAQKGFFSFWNILNDISLPNNAQKENLENWPLLDQKHGLTPLEKMSIFRLFQLLVFIAQNGVFVVLEYHKRHFPGQYCVKTNGKMAIFGPKPWVRPCGKMAIFDFLNFLFFQPKKSFFRSGIS